MAALQQARLNTLIDYLYRGGSRATLHFGLLIVMPTRSTQGTEMSVGGGYTGYTRQSITASLANFSGTQSDGSTSASSGTRDYITNNVPITFAATLAANWPGAVAAGIYSAASGGVLEEWQPITDSAGTPITLSRNIGEPWVIAPGELRLYLR